MSNNSEYHNPDRRTYNLRERKGKSFYKDLVSSSDEHNINKHPLANQTEAQHYSNSSEEDIIEDHQGAPREENLDIQEPEIQQRDQIHVAAVPQLEPEEDIQ